MKNYSDDPALNAALQADAAKLEAEGMDPGLSLEELEETPAAKVADLAIALMRSQQRANERKPVVRWEEACTIPQTLNRGNHD